jgi:hypothetical protein
LVKADAGAVALFVHHQDRILPHAEVTEPTGDAGVGAGQRDLPPGLADAGRAGGEQGFALHGQTVNLGSVPNVGNDGSNGGLPRCVSWSIIGEYRLALLDECAHALTLVGMAETGAE